MKYLQTKNRATDTAPDMTGDKNQDETATKQTHQLVGDSVSLSVKKHSYRSVRWRRNFCVHSMQTCQIIHFSRYTKTVQKSADQMFCDTRRIAVTEQCIIIIIFSNILSCSSSQIMPGSPEEAYEINQQKM